MRWILLVTASTVASAQNAVPPAAQDALRTALEKQQAAVAKQKEAIKKQAENLGLWLPPGLDSRTVTTAAAESAVDPGCDPLGDAAVAPIIDAAAKAQALDPKLLRAVIEQESAYRPCAVSPKGARGLMQLMPDTAAQFGVTNMFDPQKNVDAGAKFLKQLMVKYAGDLPQVLGAYNAGPATVDQAGGVPDIRETRDYVNAILKKLSTPAAEPAPSPNAIPPVKPVEN